MATSHKSLKLQQITVYFTCLLASVLISGILSAQESEQIHLQDFDGFTNAEYADYLKNDGWPVEELNTAADVNYLTDDEKNLILAMNLIRHNPPRYAELYIYPLIRYFDGTLLRFPGRIPLRTQEGAAAVKELYNELKKASPLSVFDPSPGMSRAASDHARYMKKRGTASHDGRGDMGSRLSRHGQWHGAIAENLHWGASNAHDAIISLMVDDGVKNRGHRINMMDPEYRYVGVAIEEHPRFRMSYVIKYAIGFTDK